MFYISKMMIVFFEDNYKIVYKKIYNFLKKKIGIYSEEKIDTKY